MVKDMFSEGYSGFVENSFFHILFFVLGVLTIVFIIKTISFLINNTYIFYWIVLGLLVMLLALYISFKIMDIILNHSLKFMTKDLKRNKK